MRIDAYNQVAQLYGIQKNLKTQRRRMQQVREIRCPFHRPDVIIRSQKVQYQKLRISGKIR